MYCKNCGKECNNDNFCTNCGSKIVKKAKLSIVSIISLIMLILSMAAPIALIIYSADQSSSNEAYGWLIAIVLMVAILIVPYYSIIFVVSYTCDKKVKKNKLLKNIIIIFFLLLPFLWVIKQYVYSKFDNNKLNYEYKDMYLPFPNDTKI